jgi:hypothetical protein
VEDLGAIALIPTLAVFVLAIITHRPIESVISRSIVARLARPYTSSSLGL